MTLPTIDGLHYVGCHCNDICVCSDPIECIHEECICDRLSAAYKCGREDAENERNERHRKLANELMAEIDLAAARGDGEQG